MTMLQPAATKRAFLLLLTVALTGMCRAQSNVARLTLQDAVQLALKNNPAVQASAAYAKSVDQGIAAAEAAGSMS